MEPSENDSLARGSLAGSEEVLVAPGEPRRWEESIMHKLAVGTSDTAFYEQVK